MSSENRPVEQNKSGGNPLDRYSVQPKPEQKDDSPFFKSAAPSIQMPKGGGALKGIDEKFTVNAVNGSAALDIPLPMSPGRGGFTPALSLSYNSGSGNSEFGLGWSLGLPSIQRKTDKRLPRYDDANDSDIFLLAGAEDLVPLLDDQGLAVVSAPVSGLKIRQFRPRIEGLFARIEFCTDASNAGGWWRITTKDNITTWYGLSAASRIADPEDNTRVFKWLPDLVCDHKGNVQQYIYKEEDLIGVAGGHEWNRINGLAPIANRYLKRIRYCNATPFFPEDSNIYMPALAFGGQGFLMDAVLDYGDHSATNYLPDPDQLWSCRTDAFSDFHPGFELRTYRKCRRVLMFHTFSELNSGTPTLVRSLDIAYQQDAIQSPLCEADFPVSFTQTGYRKEGSDYVTKSLPALTVSHQPLQWDLTLKTVSQQDAWNAPQGLSGPYQWTDLWGEGIPGILHEQQSGWYYKANLGGGHFAPALQVSPKPSFNGLGKLTEWQDLDADGRRQLVSHTPGAEGYFEMEDAPSPEVVQRSVQGLGSAENLQNRWKPFRPFPSKANVNWNSPFIKLLDLDGDGRPDLLLTEDRVWTWYRNEGTRGMASGGESRVALDEEKGPRLLLNDKVQRIFLADMNGDGLTDLVRIRNGEVCYWPNRGWGRFGAKVTMSNAPRFDNPDDFNPRYLTLADISGTGAPDLIYLGNDRCTAWLNLSGNGWSDSKELGPLPAVTPDSSISILDFLGNGTGCIVWSSALPMHANAPLRYIDLMGGVKPYLMLSYNNGMGKEVAVTYKSSTHYYLSDKLAGKPWATRLPFPVHCVARISTSDSVSETFYAQEYSYHHGYYDHEEREFRGFGRVDSYDTDAAKAPVAGQGVPLNIPGGDGWLDQAPVLTKTWYHTGAWIREGTLLEAFRKEYFRFDGWDDLVDIAALPTGLNPQEQREAHRALKGLALRQEVYAVDGSLKQDVPYSVTASAYTVRLVQAQHNNRFASFHSYQQQSIAYGCERNSSDPHIAQQITLEVDEYGNVLRAAQVAYPRQLADASLAPVVQAEQAKMHVTFSENSFTNDAITAGHYRLRLAFEARSYELTGYSTPTGLWTVDGLNSQINGATEIDFSDTPGTGIEKRLLSQVRHLYLKDDTSAALAAGVLEPLALPYQQFTLAYTADTLSAANGSLVTNAMLTEGGYTATDSNTRWWIPSGTAQYGSTPKAIFYTPLSYTDPFGNVTTVDWDTHTLLPLKTTDAVGNVTEVTAYDWRLMAPLGIKDPNSNISQICYDALGMPVAMAVMGKGTEADYLQPLSASTPLIADDTADLAAQADFWQAVSSADLDLAAKTLLGKATWRCIYDLSASPLRVAMIARQQHYTADAASPTLVRITYTDGFGRVAMMKAQAADDPATSSARWIGSGKTVYNNKGKAVLQYEPYFSPTHAYDPALQAANLGVSPRMYYDPLGRLRRTDMPDGTFSYTEWDAWSQTIFDANDALGTWTGTPGSSSFLSTCGWYDQRIGGALGAEEQDAAQKAAIHAGTPARVHLDSLARPFFTIQHNRYLDNSNVWTDQLIESREVLDMTGNRLAVIDGRGLTPLTYKYNLLKSPIYQHSIDGGAAHMLLDVAGQPLYHWDADGRMTHMAYDALRRPLSRKLTTGTSTATLDEWFYNDTSAAESLNWRTRLAYCNSGNRSETYIYDFNGAVVNTYYSYTQGQQGEPDWSTSPAVEAYRRRYVSVDALGRPRVAFSQRSTDFLSRGEYYGYDRGGALNYVFGNAGQGLSQAEYNARGQQTKAVFANGTRTRYYYDDTTHRLTGIETLRTSDNATLQDLRYWYDAAGNITLKRDEAQQTIFYNNTIAAPENDYTYDALYRLIKASGREHFSSGSSPEPNTYNDSPRIQLAHKADETAMRPYTQRYEYDEVGNMLKMKHITTVSACNWTRNFVIDTASNRLLGMWMGSSFTALDESYTYDGRGNMTAGMSHVQGMTYNGSNRLDTVGITSTRTAYYQYSADGNRTRKWLQDGSTTEERQYLDGYFEEYRRKVSGTLDVERITHRVSAGGVMLQHDSRTVGSGSGEPAEIVRYQYADHLGSSGLELDENGAVISYEEYYPYGATSFQSGRSSAEVALKRYRYTGKERDEETGLNYHGARYYAPWLCRWCAVDPLESRYAGWSNYNYCTCNPIDHTDSTGMGNDPKQAPTMADGTPANYTFIQNVYDYKGNLQSSNTFMTNQEYEGYAHGEYVTNISLPDPNRPVIRDGNLVVANMPSVSNSFTPYGNPETGQESIDWNKVATRTWGGLKLAGGVLEMVGGAAAGAATSWTGIGAVGGGLAVIHGADVASSGLMQLLGGEETTTFTHQGIQSGLQTAGVNPETANKAAGYADAGISIGLTLGTNIASGPVPLAISKTGTVWDDIIATQANYTNTVLPQSFELGTENGVRIWVANNATKHMNELIASWKTIGYQPEKINLMTQQILRGLQSAVNAATKNGVVYDQLITIGGWELKFGAPRQAGQLPALFHARPIQ